MKFMFDDRYEVEIKAVSFFNGEDKTKHVLDVLGLYLRDAARYNEMQGYTATARMIRGIADGFNRAD